MRKWDKTRIATIAGLLAYIVTILILFIPFKGESAMSLINWQTPLGIVVIVFFVVSITLYAIACFKRELSYPDKEKKVKQRQENLPLLRNSIDAILERQKELAFEIGKRPLQNFFDEYLKKSKEYKLHRKLLNTFHTSDKTTKHKVAILVAIAKFFFAKTICLNDECKDDERMTRLQAKKEVYYHRNDDRELSRDIDYLFTAAAKYHSALAFSELATNNQLSYTSAEKYAAFEEKPEILHRAMVKAYKAMNDRMELLKGGEDL